MIREDKYVSTYVCKLCGEKFYDAYGTEKVAEESMLEYMALGHFNNPMLHKSQIHNCKNGNMGVASFIGFTKGPLDCE